MKLQTHKLPAPIYRLTLSQEAFMAVANHAKLSLSFSGRGVVKRADGKWDVAISMNLLDQLKTAAFAGENLSDTVLRIISVQKGLH